LAAPRSSFLVLGGGLLYSFFKYSLYFFAIKLLAISKKKVVIEQKINVSLDEFVIPDAGSFQKKS
jgi:hypothetical protein